MTMRSYKICDFEPHMWHDNEIKSQDARENDKIRYFMNEFYDFI